MYIMEISEEWFASLTRFETDLIKTYLDIGDPKKSDTIPEIDGPVLLRPFKERKTEISVQGLQQNFHDGLQVFL